MNKLSEDLKRHRELLGYDPTKGTTTLTEVRRHTYTMDEENTDYADEEETETEETETEEGEDNPDFDFGGEEGTEEEGGEEETDDEFGTADEFSAVDDIESEEDSDTEEIDVTDIVKRADDAKGYAEKAVTAAEEGKNMIQDLMTKFEALQTSLSKIDTVSNEIQSMKKDIQSQRPKEKLELRSLDSYPFNVKLTDYWNDEKIKANYEINGGTPDAESPDGEVKVWKLDPNEAKDFSTVDIKKSFVPESKSKKKVLTENLILNSRQQTQFIDLLKNELPHEYRIMVGGMTESGIDFYDIEKDGGKHVSLTLNDVNSPEQYITLFRMDEWDEDFLGDYEKIGSSVEEIFYNVKDNLIRDIKKSFVPESKSKKRRI
jgi:hypothetical protein